MQNKTIKLELTEEQLNTIEVRLLEEVIRCQAEKQNETDTKYIIGLESEIKDTMDVYKEIERQKIGQED